MTLVEDAINVTVFRVFVAVTDAPLVIEAVATACNLYVNVDESITVTV